MIQHTLENLLLQTAEAIRPPERLTVSEAAEKYRYLNNPGSYVGPWNNGIAPYLVEVMDTMTSVDFTGIAFAGPARCGKSDGFFNWLGHTVICDPTDMLLFHMTQASARDWSQGDLRKVFRASKEIGKRVMTGRQNMNTHDVKFTNGMRLLVKWPTITEMSGKTVRYVWLMDMDRMPLDVDKEGNPFDLAKKRTQTFGRYGMTVAESSPGHEIENPRWIAGTPHEAPPTKGVLAIYNRGDRRRWYWRCAGCEEPFEADFQHLNYPSTPDHLEAAEAATLDCPYCGFAHTHDPGPGQPGKRGLNLGGKWIRDGQTWNADGSVTGIPARSDIASFWLKGVAAAFVDWKTLVFKYLKAMEEYERNGATESLKATVNTDQGHPFLSPAMIGDRLPEDLKSRARDLGKGLVPDGVRFLIATIDVQKNKFIVQVHGIGVGGDITIVDRFEIKKSKRIDEDGERLWVDPAGHLEDWELLVDEVLTKSYPLGDSSGRRMMIKVVGCDSGGREGVTAKAYEFWRWLRDSEPAGHHRRFQLIKGEPSRTAPRVRINFPDTDRKDRRASSRGEVPVLMINTNLVKDMAHAMLGRTDPYGGAVYFPDWLPNSFYTELTVEIRSVKGWENPKKHRNESWDLLVYCIGLCLSRNVNIERINWDAPDSWADEWDNNPLVFQEEQEAPFQPSTAKMKFSLADLAKSLG